MGFLRMVSRYTNAIFRERNPFDDGVHKPRIWKVTEDIEADDKFRGMPVPSLHLVRPTNLIASAELHFVDRPDLGPHFLVDVREPDAPKPDLVAVTFDRDWVQGTKMPRITSRMDPVVNVFSYRPGVVPSEAKPHPASSQIIQRLASLFWHAGKEASELEAQGKREDTYPKSLKASAIRRVAIALIHAADHAYAADLRKEP